MLNQTDLSLMFSGQSPMESYPTPYLLEPAAMTKPDKNAACHHCESLQCEVRKTCPDNQKGSGAATPRTLTRQRSGPLVSKRLHNSRCRNPKTNQPKKKGAKKHEPKHRHH
jgi:hypothetical protein